VEVSSSLSFTAASSVSFSTLPSAREIRRPISSISGSFIPRVVRAGVPIRMPEATMGLFVSKGIVFLLTVIPASSRAFSATFPVMPFENTSTSIRWVSVPPDTSRQPSPASVAARTLALATICFW
jgi:hypothetical protein